MKQGLPAFAVAAPPLPAERASIREHGQIEGMISGSAGGTRFDNVLLTAF